MMEFHKGTSLLGAQKKMGMGCHGGYSVQWTTNKSSNNWMVKSDDEYFTGTKGFKILRLSHYWKSGRGTAFDEFDISSMDKAMDLNLPANVDNQYGDLAVKFFKGQIESEWGKLLGYLTGMIARYVPREFMTVEEHQRFYDQTMNNQVRNTGEFLASDFRAASFPEYEMLQRQEPKFNARGDGYHFLINGEHWGHQAKMDIPMDGSKFSVFDAREFGGFFSAHYPCTDFDRQYIDQRFEALDRILKHVKDATIPGNWDDHGSDMEHTQYPGSKIYPEL